MELLSATPLPLDLPWSERIAYIAWKIKQDGGSAPEDFPVQQWISNGRYIRQFELPADFLFIGRVHKLGHMVLLCEGSAVLLTPQRNLTYYALDAINTPAGFQTVARTFTEVKVRTIHPLPPGEPLSFPELEAMYFEPAESILSLGRSVQAKLFPVQESLS